MHRRLWLSVTMLVAGASLLVAASFASAGTARQQRTQEGRDLAVRARPALRSRSTRSSPTSPPRGGSSTRPQRSSTTIRTRRAPRAASSSPRSLRSSPSRTAARGTPSRSGKGFTFSDGTTVTAKNFKYAIDRTANHDLASPGAQFITDPNGTNIVGAKAVNDGNGTNVSGVTVKGNKLIINLTQGRRNVHGEDHHAVLPGDLDEASAHEGSRQRQRARTCRRPARTTWRGTTPTG